MDSGLSSWFFQAVSHGSGLTEIVLLDMVWYVFGIAVRPGELAVVEDIVRAQTVESHVGPPLVIPDLEFVT